MGRSRKTDPRLWERTFLLNHAMIRELRRQIEARFPLGWSGTILDVGCGYEPYRPLFEGRCAEYVGCDQYPVNDAIVECPADELAFEDNRFEAVVCFQVLEHVPRPWSVVAECARVLAPGGTLLLTTPFVFPHHPSPTDFYRYTHEGLAQLAREAGLEVEEITAQVRSLTTLCLLMNWYNGLLHGKLDKRWKTKPLAWAVMGLGIVPVNLAGLALERVPLRDDFEMGNMGYSNYVMIARKPSPE